MSETKTITEVTNLYLLAAIKLAAKSMSGHIGNSSVVMTETATDGSKIEVQRTVAVTEKFFIKPGEEYVAKGDKKTHLKDDTRVQRWLKVGVLSDNEVKAASKLLRLTFKQDNPDMASNVMFMVDMPQSENSVAKKCNDKHLENVDPSSRVAPATASRNFNTTDLVSCNGVSFAPLRKLTYKSYVNKVCPTKADWKKWEKELAA